MKVNKKDLAVFLVKIPAELEAKIQNEAKDQRRTRHAQVVRILEERYATFAPTTRKEPALAK